MTRTFSRPSVSRIGIEGRSVAVVAFNERRTRRTIANSKAIATTIATKRASKKKPAMRKKATIGMTMRSKKIARKLEFMDFLEFMGEIDGADRKAFAEGGSCTMGIRIGRGKSMHEKI